LRNWYHIDRAQGLSQQSKFHLVDAPQAVAAQRGLPAGGENFVAFGDRIDDRLGMITCMVYTFGWEGVDANPNPPKTMGLKGQFAFGEGGRENTQIRWDLGERGILLAAMTLHYRTPDELDQIRSAGCVEPAATSAEPLGPSQAGTSPPIAEGGTPQHGAAAQGAATGPAGPVAGEADVPGED